MNSTTQTAAEGSDLAFTQIVARSDQWTWTRRALRLAFSRVENADNWKLSIDKTVTVRTARELEGIRQAVMFYTGSVPTCERLASIGRRGFTVRVEADGYYKTIGA